MGPRTRPWFQIRGDLAFAVDEHPEADGTVPWYWHLDGRWFPASDHEGGPASLAWFREADRSVEHSDPSA